MAARCSPLGAARCGAVWRLPGLQTSGVRSLRSMPPTATPLMLSSLQPGATCDQNNCVL